MRSNETEAAPSLEAVIHDRGRGPEIKGTRITVYTVLEYLLGAWSKERIAQLLNLSNAQVQAAIDYIEANDLDVLRDYVKILERIRRGNPPDLQAKLDARHVQFQELVKEVRAIEGQAKADIHDLIDRYRQRPVEEPAHAGHRGGQ